MSNETNSKTPAQVNDEKASGEEELSQDELDAVSGGMRIVGGAYSGGDDVGSLDPEGGGGPRLP